MEVHGIVDKRVCGTGQGGCLLCIPFLFLFSFLSCIYVVIVVLVRLSLNHLLLFAFSMWLCIRVVSSQKLVKMELCSSVSISNSESPFICFIVKYSSYLQITLYRVVALSFLEVNFTEFSSQLHC